MDFDEDFDDIFQNDSDFLSPSSCIRDIQTVSLLECASMLLALSTALFVRPCLH